MTFPLYWWQCGQHCLEAIEISRFNNCFFDYFFFQKKIFSQKSNNPNSFVHISMSFHSQRHLNESLHHRYANNNDKYNKLMMMANVPCCCLSSKSKSKSLQNAITIQSVLAQIRTTYVLLFILYCIVFLLEIQCNPISSYVRASRKSTQRNKLMVNKIVKFQ